MKKIILVFSACFLVQTMLPAQWLLTGNAGTSSTANFLGTTDNKPLRLRINNLWAGELSPQNYSCYIGVGAGELAAVNTNVWANSASLNIGIGLQALKYTSAVNNIAIGGYCMEKSTSGASNTAMGANALGNNTLGSYNTAMGQLSLNWNTSGNYNTAIGLGSLVYNTTGTYNIAVGYNAGTYSGAFNNTVSIGNNGWLNAYHNQVFLGNSSSAWIGGWKPWSVYSDGRMKKNIKEDVKGLSFILKLRPVVYNTDMDIAAKLTGNKPMDDFPQKYDADKVRLSGFVAQEVEQAATEAGYDFDGVQKPKNENSLYSISYSSFVVPLVKAVQELSKQNDEMKNEIAGLKKLLNDKTNNGGHISFSAASLEQNVPNPFGSTTTIAFTLPAKYISAAIVFTDKTGSIIRSETVSGSGKQNFTIDAHELASGIYQYSLFIDGSAVATKQMIAAK